MIDEDIKIDCEVDAENAAPNNSDEYSKRSEQTIKKKKMLIKHIANT